MCFAPQRLALFRHINFQKCSEPVSFFYTFDFAPQRLALFRHLNFQKCSDPVSFFYTFDFEMCFAPQRRALFRHLNVQKWSEPGVFLAFFSLTNVLRATTALNFSSLICPPGSAPAALASLLFNPPEPQIIRKTQCFATFLPFRAPGSSFFWDWDFLFFDLLSTSLLFTDSSHLCFSSVHIVGSLTSKLPSAIHLISVDYQFTSTTPHHHSYYHRGGGGGVAGPGAYIYIYTYIYYEYKEGTAIIPEYRVDNFRTNQQGWLFISFHITTGENSRKPQVCWSWDLASPWAAGKSGGGILAHRGHV